MKQLFSFIKKEFLHIFRDTRTLLILFGIPVAQLIIFGFVIRSEIQDVEIAILDFSSDEMTTRITDKLISSGYFILTGNLHSQNEVEHALRSGLVQEVVIFEKDFAKNIEKEGVANLQLITDASDPNNAKIITNYTRSIVNDFLEEEYPQLKNPLPIDTSVRMFFNELLRSVNLFVPGIIALILMLISAMMTSIAISREKELGTMEILLVSPLKPIQIILGKVLPYLVLSFVNTLIILLMSGLIFKVPINGSLVLLLAESILFIVMALSLGIFISTTSGSQLEAMFKSVIMLMLPTILLSGLIFPIENMPLALQYFSSIMPARWFILIVRAIMLKGVGIQFIWKETLILMVMTAVFILLSVKKFKIRLS